MVTKNQILLPAEAERDSLLGTGPTWSANCGRANVLVTSTD